MRDGNNLLSLYSNSNSNSNEQFDPRRPRPARAQPPPSAIANGNGSLGASAGAIANTSTNGTNPAPRFGQSVGGTTGVENLSLSRKGAVRRFSKDYTTSGI